MKMPDLDTIIMELKPYDTLISRDLQASLSSWMSESSTQQDILLALLAELRASLEQKKEVRASRRPD